MLIYIKKQKATLRNDPQRGFIDTQCDETYFTEAFSSSRNRKSSFVDVSQHHFPLFFPVSDKSFGKYVQFYFCIAVKLIFRSYSKYLLLFAR